MAENQQDIKQNEHQELPQNGGENQQEQQLSEADRQVYDQIFKSLSKIDKKVKTAKSKLHDKQSTKQQSNNTNFKQIAEKLIQSKQNSQIVNKEDLLTDINQSFQRAVIDIYSENQKLKKKQLQMEKIVKDQNHKIFQHQVKQENYIKQIEKLKFQLAQSKDHNLVNNRSAPKNQTQSDSKKQPAKKGAKFENNQSNQDYDFWNTPQNEGYNKKKKQFVQNSGLWVNQKNIGQSMFITEGRR